MHLTSIWNYINKIKFKVGQAWDYGQLNTIRKASSLFIVETIGKNIGKDIGT